MLFAVVALVFSSCSKDQSSFDIDDIPTNAKIIGNLSYDAGYGYTNGKYTQLIKPAANVRVIFKIKNSSISPTGTGNGYTYYETATNADGAYEIILPALENGTSVTIAPDSFLGTYSTVKSVSNNTPSFDNKETQFAIESKEITIKPYETKIYDKIYSRDDRDINKPYNYTSTFIVKVGEGVYKYDYTENQINQVYSPASSKNVLVTINDVCYGATTNSNGEAKFIIPAKNKEWTADATIEVEGYVSNNYTFYKKENNFYNKYQIEQGIFKLNSKDKSKTITFSGITNEPIPVVKARMIFYPNEGIDTYGYNYSSWNNFSWVD
jgi:hypothetical protein